MSSPDKSSITSIKINRSDTTAVYLQIAEQLIRQIQSGILAPGDKLPGTRQLASQLGVHRKTVIAAIDELVVMGWLTQVPSVGAFVLQTSAKAKPSIKSSIKNTATNEVALGFNFSRSMILDTEPEVETIYKWRLDSGILDDRLEVTKAFYARYYSILKRKLGKWEPASKAFTKTYFQQQLQNYITHTKGIALNNLAITATTSPEVALQSLVEFLIGPDNLVVVPDIGYHRANMLLLKAKAKIKKVRITAQGLDITKLEELARREKIRGVYLSPNSSYPTTYALSAACRVRLLELAKTYGFIILEDHSQTEIQLGAGLNPPLFSPQTCSHVIHIGALGSVWDHSMQLGYILTHPELKSELGKYIELYDPNPDLIKRHTLAEMIYEGYLTRLQKKMSFLMQERRDFVVDWISTHAKRSWRVHSSNYGLGIWVSTLDSVNLEQWRKLLAENQVLLPRNLVYQDAKQSGFRLHFSRYTTQELAQILTLLFNCYQQKILP